MVKRNAFTGNPYAGNPYVRFDEGEVASAATPRRGSLLYNTRKMMALAAVAASAAMYSPSFGDTAKWINVNNGGNMSAAANWENGYVPRSGDTLDFTVMTATYKGIVQDIADDIQFETMTGFNVSLNSSSVATNWNFTYLTSPGCEVGGFNFYGYAHLNVEGKITYTGEKPFFVSDTSSNVGGIGGVTADEFEYTGPAGRHIIRAHHRNWGGFRAGTFIHNGAGHLFLSSYYPNGDNTKTHYVVGNGGFAFGDTRANAADRYYYISLDNNWVRTVRIDPYADYSFAANPTRSDNMAVSMYSQCALELGTSDFDNPLVPRTVTCAGGIGGYLGGTTADKMNITVDGCGFVFFNTASGGACFPGTITVKDTATFVLKDTAAAAKGPMTFAAGTTLKAVQTSAAGTVTLGGAVTLAADAVLAFDLASGATAAPLRLNGLTLPASGTVKVKVSNSPRKKCTLIENLPAGTTANKFAFAARPYVNARLYVEDNQLKMKAAGLMIVVK